MWNVIGQDRALAQLRCALDSGSLGHAYLLAGPAHSGKMTLALSLAAAVNCTSKEAPCGSCEQCRRIVGGLHPDVITISVITAEEAEDGRSRSEIGVGQVEELQRAAALPPFEGQHKVLIISQAEKLSAAAANRLLKTLEEPEARVLFILLTEALQSVPLTVRSRCQCLELGLVPAAVIGQALIERGSTLESASLLARTCGGRPGWALAVLKDASLLTERREQMQKLLSIMTADIEERFSYAGTLATQFGRNREKVYDMLELWLEIWHDLLRIETGCQEMVAAVDIDVELRQLVELLGLEDIRAAVESITQAMEQLRRNANARLALEVMMLNMPTAPIKVAADG